MEWFLRVISYVMIIALRLLEPIYRYVNRGRPPSLPPIGNALLNLSAVSLARKIRRREISSESVVRAYIERIKEVNPFVNALVEDRFAEALREARSCDKKLEAGDVNAVKLSVEQPFYGVPFTVKESCSLRGLSHTGLTLIRQGAKAYTDGDAVASLRNAGGIPLCVTNTPELCLSFDSDNYIVGRTSNPYDGRRIAGGSSGGEGALLGAGASLVGIGSDIAGSIRVPALFNGVFGHKPTPGIISVRGHYPNSEGGLFQRYLVIGPMTRYAEDLEFAVKVMTSKSKVDLRLDRPVEVEKLKVFHLEDIGENFGQISTDEDMRGAVQRASRYLEEIGARVSELALGDTEKIFEWAASCFFAMQETPQILMDPNDPKHEKNFLIEALKAILGLSQFTKTTIFIKFVKEVHAFIPSSRRSRYQVEANEWKKRLIELLGTDGVLVLPTYTSVAPLPNKCVLQLTSAIYCLLFNVFELPASHVPMGLNAEGLPVGVQVVAAPNQDRLCLAVAKQLEKGFGGWVPPNTG